MLFAHHLFWRWFCIATLFLTFCAGADYGGHESFGSCIPQPIDSLIYLNFTSLCWKWTCLSVMAAGFGVPIPLTRRLLSVGFARSRFPVSKSSKHGLTSLLIPGHDPPVDITIFEIRRSSQLRTLLKRVVVNRT